MTDRAVDVDMRDGDGVFAAAVPLDVASLAPLSPALVVVPHPDDESLGCGGLLALLGEAGVEMHLLLVTDGTGSHPRSLRFDAAARRALRDAEWRNAVDRLGLADASLHRLGLRDGAVPWAGDPSFPSAVADLRTHFDRIDPALVVLPWRRDPHPDHRASHALVRAVLADRPVAPRCLEYLVWILERGAPADHPRHGEALAWRLDINRVVDRKRRAIAAHRSQHGEIIRDDPNGFVIAPAMRRRAECGVEYYLEGNDRP